MLYMILFSPGIKRRAAACLCAVVLMVVLAAHPLQARAASVAAGALAAVGFATIVCAYLNASGVYPYNAVSGGGVQPDFSRWTRDNLQALVDRYNATNPALPLTPQTVKAYSVGATICVVHNAWVALRAFVLWLQSEFSLEDNQTEVNLGVSIVDLPVWSSSVAPSYRYVWEHGVNIGDWAGQNTRVMVTPDLLVYRLPSSNGAEGVAPKTASVHPRLYMCQQHYEMASSSCSYLQASDYGTYWLITFSLTYYTDLLPIMTRQEALERISSGSVPGVTVDTSAISVPAELPADSEFGGLQVAGLGTGATVQALEDVIEAGVMERLQPAVRPVEVEVGTGAEVDTDTGAVAENPVIIMPDSVVLTSSEFALPRAISTVFPFSVPWDIMRVYQALDAEPAFPEIHAYLYVPGSSFVNPDYVDDKIPFTIGIPEDMKPGFDAFAEKFRSIALLLACIAVTWAMVKFIRF